MPAITAIAASPGRSTPVSISGTSNASSAAATFGETSTPPATKPRMIEATVSPSIQPLAMTSFSGGSSSVRMPYLAGEYAAAPSPTTAYASSGCTPKNISRQPPILTVFVTNITRPFGIESAKAPTKAASATYEMKKNSLSIGVIHSGAWMSRSSAIAAISNALSASDEKNCAAMIV